MLIETKNLRIFLYQEIVDMRSGFERLSYFVRERMRNQVLNHGHLYLFLGKNRKRLKALFYDGTGLVLVSKKIERGRFMSGLELGEIYEISVAEFKQIFHGGVLVRAKVDRDFSMPSRMTPTMTQVGQVLLPSGVSP